MTELNEVVTVEVRVNPPAMSPSRRLWSVAFEIDPNWMRRSWLRIFAKVALELR